MKMMTAELIVDETKQDTARRRITSLQRREELPRGYDQRGIIEAEFARRKGVNYQTFVEWVRERRLRTTAAKGSRPAGRVPFAEVNLPPPTPRELSPNADALRVTLPDGFGRAHGRHGRGSSARQSICGPNNMLGFPWALKGYLATVRVDMRKWFILKTAVGINRRLSLFETTPSSRYANSTPNVARSRRDFDPHRRLQMAPIE